MARPSTPHTPATHPPGERDRVTVTIARRELRKWLRASPEGQAVEDAVGRLLGE